MPVQHKYVQELSGWRSERGKTSVSKKIIKKMELMPRLWIALKLIIGKLLQIRVTYFTLIYVKHECSSPFRINRKM